DQPEAQDAGKETRPVHQEAEGEEPQTPKDLIGNDALVMQAQEEHGEGVALRLVEYGQETGAAHHYQGSSVVQRVEEIDGGHHQTPEYHHQPSEVLVHCLEQPVQSQREEDGHG